MESRGFAFLKRLVIVNLSVVVVVLVVVLEFNDLFPYYYQCLLLSSGAISLMLGMGFLAGGLTYVEGSPIKIKIKAFLLGLLLGGMAGSGIYVLLDWILFSHMRLWVRNEELYSLLLLLLICAAPQVVQLLISKHKKVIVVVSLLVTAVLFGLTYEVLLMLNADALYNFSIFIVMSLMPSVIVITQALVARYLPR